MTSQAERDARVANAAEAWLADPMKRSLYGELLSAVRSRQAGNGTPPPLAANATPLAAREVASAYGATAPKRHRDPDFLAVKQGRLREEHVAPLQALVDEIRQDRDTDSVPYVDPDSGGVGAPVLFILESPAGPAALGSGMLSPDNDDETAANMWRLYEQAGLPRSAGLHWNAAPGTSGRTARRRTSARATCLKAGSGSTGCSTCCQSFVWS